MLQMTAAEARGALLAVVLLALAGLPARAPREAPPPATAPARPADDVPGRVDLNGADAAALTALPGIGPVLAERIVAHRERHGPFAAVGELAAVRGIGPRLIERLGDRVVAGSRPDTLKR